MINESQDGYDQSHGCTQLGLKDEGAEVDLRTEIRYGDQMWFLFVLMCVYLVGWTLTLGGIVPSVLGLDWLCSVH